MKEIKNTKMCQSQNNKMFDENKIYEFDKHKFVVESAYNDNGLEDIGSILLRMIINSA